MCNNNKRKAFFEEDFYGVLGFDDIADIETAIKRFKRLSLYFHPGNFFYSCTF